MPFGTPVSRHCILILRDGRIVADWGNHQFQDLISGDFIVCKESEISHTAQDEDLEPMKLSGVVADYDAGSRNVAMSFCEPRSW